MLIRSFTILVTQHVPLHEFGQNGTESGQVSRFQQYPAMDEESRCCAVSMELFKFTKNQQSISGFEREGEGMEYVESLRFGGCDWYFGTCSGYQGCERTEGEGERVLESWEVF
jgi:hypothetical protein